MRRRRWSNTTNTTNTTRQQGKLHTTQQHTSKVAKASKASKHAPTATRKDTLRAHATRSNVKKEGKKAKTKEANSPEKAKEKARRGVETETKHKNRTNPTQIRPFLSLLKSKPSHYTAQMRAKAIPATMPTTTVPTTPAGQSDATSTADSHNNTQTTSRRCHSWPM